MQAFEGIRVIDLTRVLAGPYASYQFAMLGADVIKIEPPGKGDTTRWRTENDPKLGDAGMSPSYMAQSANKRSLSLNLDSEQGQEIFLKLVATADVVVENLRTGSMAKRNIGYDQACRVKPDIIYCSATGYGQTGPKAQYPAYDSVIQAAAGLMSVTGTSESGPLKVGPPVVDYAMGQVAAFAISAALYQRLRTGQGQHIDVSMLDTCMALMTSMLTIHLNTGAQPGRRGNEAASRSPASTTFATREGLLAIAINEQHQFANLFRAINRADVLTDERFKDAASRREHTEELRNMIGRALLDRSATEWEVILNEASVPAARVATVAEVAADPQVGSRDFFHRFAADEIGLDRDIRLPLTAFRFRTDGPKLSTPPPYAGADTDTILESLGYSNAAIKEFRAGGII
jgi:CoA:oxalate CoA-transferase